MSLYNTLFGYSQSAPMLLAILGVSAKNIPRFRNCYIDEGRIAIHTRTGGGNRDYYESLESCKESYPEYFKEGEDAPTGPWNDDLRKIAGFLFDEDDNFDSTYATFYYSFPEKYAEDLKALEQNLPDKKPSEQWQELFKKLQEPTP